MFNLNCDATYNDFTLNSYTYTISCDSQEDWDNFVVESRDNADGTKFVKIGIKMFSELIYLCPGIVQWRQYITTTDNQPFDGARLLGTQYIECDNVTIERNND